TVLLIADLGSSADNINALFDDSAPAGPDSTTHAPPPPYYTDHPWLPVQPLAAFRGVVSAGDWTLDVCDDAGGDAGTLEQWTLFMETDVVVLDPSGQGANACPGDTVSYDLTVLNGTTTAQPFTLAYTGNSWVVTGPGATGTLSTGAEETITFTHDVPVTAMPGDSDTVTVTATGTVTNSATATTTVPVVAGWGDLAPLLPTARPTRAHSTVYHGGKLYKNGGYDGAARAFLDIYDIATDTWSTGADMPGVRYWLDCAAIADKIYCGGGYSTAGQDDLYIYDIGTDTWSTGALLPANRYAYTAEALGGKYYILGGYTTTYVGTILAYDPVSNTWDSTLPSMSVARRDAQSGVIGGKIYVVSGRSAASGYLASGEVYDPMANTWSPIADMPVSSWLMAADGVIGDRYLILAGGYLNSTATASNFAWAYDAVTDSYSLLPSMAHLLYSAEGASDGSAFWVASGRLYEGTFRYSEYTFRAYACADRTDLAVAKASVPTEVVAGEPVTYEIIAGNTGPNPAMGATVSDTFPGLIDVTWTCVPSPGATCTAAGSGDILDTVSLEVGAAAVYAATGTVPSSATGTLENTAEVFLGTLSDLNPADNQDTEIDTIVLQADLNISKTDNLDQATLGQAVTYTIEVCNPGPSDAPGSLVTDVFNALFLNPTWTCSGWGGGTCTPSGSGDIADAADLPALSCVTYSATGTIDFAAPAGPNDNIATVTPAADVTDPNPTDNTSTDLTDIVFADLAITKDNGVTNVAPGDPVVYTIGVVNNGPNDVALARVTDVFTTDLVNVSWTCVGGGGGACAPAGTGDINDVVVLPNGGTVTYTVDATVSTAALGVPLDVGPAIVNTATVFSNVDVADPILGNNVATDVDILAVTDVDLAISKDDGACYVLPGGTTTYTITVTNAGPATAVDATVVDAFPADVASVSWTCAASGGASCTPSGTGDINDTVTVPPSGSVVYSASATVDASAGGYLVNTATVAPAMGVTDLDLSNNASTDTNALELPVFCDGFESGTTDAWSSVLP
ncbi:MAG TPA: kelch repeat-containing protein, partial [Candidatus Sulfomarinibacteraceae bacterium]|nr:kelch repeat-containing protein [Candidatus Sulfomarinibacteraceae bacterium]